MTMEDTVPWLSAGCFSGYVTIARWNLSEAKCGLGGMKRDTGGALQHRMNAISTASSHQRKAGHSST